MSSSRVLWRGFRLPALFACVCLALAAPGAAAKQDTAANWDNVHENGPPDYPGPAPQEPNTAEPGLETTADGVLHLAWVHHRPNGEQALLHVATDEGGVLIREEPQVIAVATPPGQSLNDRVDLVRTTDGGLRVFFSGLFPGQPIDGIMATSTAPASGAQWSAPVPASATANAQRSPVYAAAGIGAGVDTEGIFTSAWGDSQPDGGGYRVGLGTNGADSKFSPACCEIDPGVGSDSQTGETMVAANLIDSGIQIRSIDTGQTFTVPESVGAWRQQRTSIAGRIGAPGIVVGYGRGTNMFEAFPAIWQVGAEKFRFLKKQQGAEHVGMAPAPGGKVWLYWERNGLINATRSNSDLTKFGTIVKKEPPGISSPDDTVVYRLNGDATEGRLRLVALAQTEEDANTAEYTGLGFWMHVFQAGLTLKADPDPVKAGKTLKVTVLDAGDPVSGVNVRLGSGSKPALDQGSTGQDGAVKLKVPGDAPKGNTPLRAQLNPALTHPSGYERAETSVKIKKG